MRSSILPSEITSGLRWRPGARPSIDALKRPSALTSYPWCCGRDLPILSGWMVPPGLHGLLHPNVHGHCWDCAIWLGRRGGPLGQLVLSVWHHQLLADWLGNTRRESPCGPMTVTSLVILALEYDVSEQLGSMDYSRALPELFARPQSFHLPWVRKRLRSGSWVRYGQRNVRPSEPLPE